MSRALILRVVGATALLFLVVAIPRSGVSWWRTHVVSGDPALMESATPRQQAVRAPRRTALRGGIGAMISPERTLSEYEHLYRLVARKLPVTADIAQRRRYAEVNALLERGEIDFAWVCTGAAADLTARRVAFAVVAPVVAGAPRYRAYLIVRSNSGFTSFADLRGQRFAFTDPLSLTGRAVTIDHLRTIGETPETYFRDSFFTYAHDNSVRAVKRGLADAATVDSLVYDLLASRYPDEVKGLRIIWHSEWFPTPPIVVSSHEQEETVRRLRKAFTTLHEDPEGRAILAAIGIDRFAPIDARAYAAR